MQAATVVLISELKLTHYRSLQNSYQEHARDKRICLRKQNYKQGLYHYIFSCLLKDNINTATQSNLDALFTMPGILRGCKFSFFLKQLLTWVLQKTELKEKDIKLLLFQITKAFWK